jgi:SAM-dependent methyltransferase
MKVLDNPDNTSINSSFEKVAQSYNEQMGSNGDFNHLTNLDPSILRLLGDIKDATIYDIGCGNGYFDFQLLKLGAGRVHGSDISPTLIEFAKNRAKAEQISTLHFHVNDALDFSHLEGLENCFDAAVSNVAVHYIQDLEKLAVGIHRILRSGSKFVFTVAHPIDDFAFYKELPKKELVSIAESYLKPYSHTVFWGKDNPIEIYKRPVSFYVSVFCKYGFVLSGMEELPKIYRDNSLETQQTKLPGFITYCFTKV